MTDINTWNTTDDSNNVASPAGWPEGMMPSGVNNSARAMMGSLKRWRDQAQPTVVATGSANAQIITYPVAPAALAAGDRFTFYSQGNNTGATTLQVNAQPAKAIRSALNVALVGGEMFGGVAVSVFYDGTNFRLANDAASLKKTGDVMTGSLTAPSIIYSGLPGNIGNHAFALGWDGSNMQAYVDGANVAIIGDITSVTAGNGLTGGGAAGAVTLAMSGSFSGAFTASGNITTPGTLGATTAVSSGGTMYCAGTLTTGAVTASGIIQGYDLDAVHTVNTVNVNATNGINAGGTIAGAYLYSSGSVDGVSVVLPNGGNYYGRDTGGTPQAMLSKGNDNWTYLAPSGGVVTTPAAFACNNHLYSLANGGFYCGLSANAWAGVISFSFPAPSDQRLKTDIQELPDNCSALVGAITPKRYRWRDGVNALDPARTHWGFIAQEIGEVFTSAGLDFGGHTVGDDDDHTEALDTGELVSVLWGAVKELMARVKQLETALVK